MASITISKGDNMIKKGDNLPNSVLMVMGKNNSPEPTTAEALFAGKRAVLFAVPGAFTPTCSAKHVPGFLNAMKDLHAKKIDIVACLSVNDVFVMHAWGKDQNVGDNIVMIADGSGKFTAECGLELDLVAKGLGVRSQRYAMVLNGTKVEQLWVEEGGEFKVSSAEYVLSQI